MDIVHYLIRSGIWQIIHTIGDILASTTGLHYSKDGVTWNPTKTSKEGKEPWRALYS